MQLTCDLIRFFFAGILADEARFLQHGIMHSCIGRTFYAYYEEDNVKLGQDLRRTMEKYPGFLEGCSCDQEESLPELSDDGSDGEFPTRLTVTEVSLSLFGSVTLGSLVLQECVCWTVHCSFRWTIWDVNGLQAGMFFTNAINTSMFSYVP